LTFKAVNKLLLRGSKNIIDPVYLIEFVLSWEKWFFGDEFEEDASEPPNVHLLIIISVGHEALWGSIPPGGDVVSVGWGWMFALARAEIC
jgi:hypothetical protein